MSYVITWITDSLGVGRAPMSYEELDEIRAQGIRGIVNLCHEFSDLHELEEKAGFEVYYLPILDECAPDIDELEKCLHWLDEAIYLKKKILVHCRFGQGRTGTLTSAYLLRRGLGMKRAKKELKKTHAQPATYRQWKFLKKYGKGQRILPGKSPQISHDRPDRLSMFYSEYQKLAESVDTEMHRSGIEQRCGQSNDRCCHTSFYLPLLEALYVNDSLNRHLTSQARTEAIDRALACSKQLKKSLHCLIQRQPEELQELFIREPLLCPLSVNGSCILFSARPIRCRSNGGRVLEQTFMKRVLADLNRLSHETFLMLAGQFPQGQGISSSMIDTVSGKFIQTYFHLMAKSKN